MYFQNMTLDLVVTPIKNERDLKFMYYEKATKFEENSHLVLTLLSNVKTKTEISSNFCGLLRKPQFYLPTFIYFFTSY